MKVLVLSSSDIQKSLDLTGLRKCMVRALSHFSQGKALNAPRHVVEISSERAMGFMPSASAASSDSTENGIFGYKAVSVFKSNARRGLNPHQGLVTLLNPETGEVTALLEGSTLTALRTAAASAAATEVLSRGDSQTLALIGSGRQAFEHTLALLPVRNFKRIVICARTRESAKLLMYKLREHIPAEIEIEEQRTPNAAVKNADVVVTCTSSPKPLLDISEISPGTHINAIGACRPGSVEVTLRNQPGLKIFMDSRIACFNEASEIVNPLAAGQLSPSVLDEIGACFSEQNPGRTSASEITLFKSVGLGVEDIFAADFFVNRARQLGLGTAVDL